jgi:hypothetical protein
MSPEMQYAEALKKVQAMKVKENFMVIEISYSTKIVLPYKDGMAFLQALANAEKLNEGYNEQHGIQAFDREAVKMRIMSHVEYENYKMAQLLGIKPDEVATMRAAVESVKKEEATS